jgi:hypothetical protein
MGRRIEQRLSAVVGVFDKFCPVEHPERLRLTRIAQDHMEDSAMGEVVVEVRGGVVVEVYSTDARAHVFIVDWDDLTAGRSHTGIVAQRGTPYETMPLETKMVLARSANAG